LPVPAAGRAGGVRAAGAPVRDSFCFVGLGIVETVSYQKE